MKAICVSNTSLGLFYQDYKEKKIQIPPHQEPRSVCGGMWDERKSREWIKKIKQLADSCFTSNEKHLGTSIQTYKIKGSDPNSPKYINDGVHRTIHAINWFAQRITPPLDLKRKNKKLYAKKLKNLEKFYNEINQISITECYMEFDNLEEAIEEFARINTQGSTSTTYQVLSSKFPVLINEYNDNWSALIKRIDVSVAKKLIFLGFNSRKIGEILPEDSTTDRHNKEKHMRDSRASFLRYATQDSRQLSYFGLTSKFLSENKKKKAQENHKKLESDLCNFFNKNGYEECLKIVAKWESFLDEAFALYKQIYKEIFGDNKINTETAVRWWLSCYVYFKNKKVDISNIRKFTEIFLKKFQGSTSFPYINKEGIQKNITAQLQRMCLTYYEVFGLNPNEMEPERPKAKARKKAKSNQTLAPGFDHSHIKPFSINGEGEILVENRAENIKRGAKEMTEEVQKRLLLIQ